MRANTMADFWLRVSQPADGCWLWSGAMRSGYGQLQFQGTQRRAHQVAFYFAHGRWPQYVCHTCDTPACCRPDHLVEGTPAFNARERNLRGRLANKHAAKVPEIRAALARGERAVSICRRLKVCASTVSQIKHGKQWGFQCS
jgi:hypothetical protein